MADAKRPKIGYMVNATGTEATFRFKIGDGSTQDLTVGRDALPDFIFAFVAALKEVGEKRIAAEAELLRKARIRIHELTKSVEDHSEPDVTH